MFLEVGVHRCDAKVLTEVWRCHGHSGEHSDVRKTVVKSESRAIVLLTEEP